MKVSLEMGREMVEESIPVRMRFTMVIGEMVCFMVKELFGSVMDKCMKVIFKMVIIMEKVNTCIRMVTSMKEHSKMVRNMAREK